MNKYELIYIVRPQITDEDLGVIRSHVQEQITALEGVVEEEHNWGKRQLGFEIKDQTEGIYTFVQVDLPPTNSPKLKEQLKIDERIIRFMLTRADKVRPPARG